MKLNAGLWRKMRKKKEEKKKERRKENLDKGKQTKQVNKKIFKSGKGCRKKLNTVMGTG